MWIVGNVIVLVEADMWFCIELVFVLYGLSMLARDWKRSIQRETIRDFVETLKKELRDRQKAELQDWKQEQGLPSDFTLL
jgi:hypothetical protein